VSRISRYCAAAAAVLVLACLAGCRQTPVSPLELSSKAFVDGGRIPTLYTCDGQDISPPLSWGTPPGGTRAFALIMDDLDAGGWVHWVLFNLPGGAKGVREGAAPGVVRPAGGFRGQGSAGLDYVGPCPPEKDAPHRYVFRVYALDAWANIAEGATREQLLAAMEGHILAQGELTGTYSRQARGGDGT
jgi:Raf kinase inhibitor-like YbhB/YbcL family protein